MLTVKALGDGLIGVGYEEVDGDRDGVVWTSDDGMTWDRSPSNAFAGPGTQEIIAVTGWDDRMVAVGYDRSDPGVWVSDDGVHWRAHPVAGRSNPQGELRMRTVVPYGDVLVAAGTVEGGDEDAVVWVAEQ